MNGINLFPLLFSSEKVHLPANQKAKTLTSYNCLQIRVSSIKKCKRWSCIKEQRKATVLLLHQMLVYQYDFSLPPTFKKQFKQSPLSQSAELRSHFQPTRIHSLEQRTYTLIKSTHVSEETHIMLCKTQSFPITLLKLFQEDFSYKLVISDLPTT